MCPNFGYPVQSSDIYLIKYLDFCTGKIEYAFIRNGLLVLKFLAFE